MKLRESFDQGHWVMLREELLRDRACGALDRPQPAREHWPICDNDQLREFGELLAGFIEGQNLPPALFMEIQSILDALLISGGPTAAHQPSSWKAIE